MYNTNTKELIKRKDKTLKKETLRYNEYYHIQSTFDNLYKQSKEGKTFQHLYTIIVSRENILLAYRSIKRNKGSKSPGVNHHTISHWEEKDIDYYVDYVRKRLENYIPQPIRRVEIPKANGKMRPLGIPCIEDRLIQQCIKQVLEPICEAKFYNNSFGFRPNRNTKHAIAQLARRINLDKLYYVVDVDIKGFFDNVNHAKLLKQLWTIGIRDKKVISIISAMLKAEVKGIGISEKGVPQGGILSPLLANVVLNELDWWVSSQWNTFPTKFQYTQDGHRYRQLKKTGLKEMFIVRYADDFKILCRKQSEAKRAFIAVKQWLEDRLKLEISPEKSGIVDVRKHSTEFLGFQLKAFKVKNKWTVQSAMTEKAKDSAKKSVKEQVDFIVHNQKKYSVQNLNLIIAGLQSYYNSATQVSRDFRELNHKLSECLSNRLKKLRTKTGYKPKDYAKRYRTYKGNTKYVLEIALYPISHVSHSPPKLFSQDICDYTVEGRKKIHTDLCGEHLGLMNYLLENPLQNSVELNDNRLSLYSAQQGKCAVTGLPLDENMKLHHITPVSKGGTDRYKNLVLIIDAVHMLIHATGKETIERYRTMLHLSKKALNKINLYRMKVGNEIIMNE